MTDNAKVKLGDKCRDTVTGFTGVAVSEHNYLNGCRRVSVQPPVDKDGKVPDCETFDEMQLELVSEKMVKADDSSEKTGGPEKFSDNSRYPGE